MMEEIKEEDDNSYLPYIFEVSHLTDKNSFNINGSRISFKRTDEKLTKFSFSNPISQIKKQRVAIKIVKTSEKYLYLGILVNE